MKKYGSVVTLMCVGFLFLACQKPTTASLPSVIVSSEGEVAVVNGQPITADELNKAAKSQMQKIETEVYTIKKRVLDDLIEDKLIADAAKKKDLNVDKFLVQEIDDKVTKPTEDEIKSFYEANKEKAGKSFSDVREQIVNFLMQNRKARARADLLAKLRGDSTIKINIEPPRVTLDLKGLPSVGDENAKITLVEFSDYQCPFCKRVRPTIWRLMDEYKGKMRYVFGDFPLSFHQFAKKASEAARCAGDEGKYFEYNRKIFDNQDKLTVDDLKKYAKELQLNAKNFDKCLDSGKHSKDVDDAMQVGAGAGVSGTPAYFINGIMLSGAMPYESFKEVIEQEVNR